VAQCRNPHAAPPCITGQAEGGINRLKLLKPQSCGRVSFDPLCRCVLIAA